MSPSLLFIPDISGFTEFVNRTEIVHSQHVVAELLELIINSNQLGLTLSEVEGDAVLFYKEGEIPPLEAIVRQVEHLFQAFHERLKDFESRRICDCGACRTAHTLSLKVIAHAGPIEVLNVNRFKKPFGSDVILAHRLLKNDLESREYLLVTDSSLKAQGVESGSSIPADSSPGWAHWAEGFSELEEFGTVPFRYLPLTPLLDRIPDPQPLPAPPRSKHPLVGDIFVDRPVAETFELVSNLDLRLLWNRSVDDIRHEVNRVNRVGNLHHCIIDGDLLEFETVTDDFGEGRVAYGERLLEPPLVEECSAFYVMEPEAGGTRLRLEVHYRPKPFPGAFLSLLFRFGFGRKLPGILQSIKVAAEGRQDEALPATTEDNLEGAAKV